MKYRIMIMSSNPIRAIINIGLEEIETEGDIFHIVKWINANADLLKTIVYIENVDLISPKFNGFKQIKEGVRKMNKYQRYNYRVNNHLPEKYEEVDLQNEYFNQIEASNKIVSIKTKLEVIKGMFENKNVKVVYGPIDIIRDKYDQSNMDSKGPDTYPSSDNEKEFIINSKKPDNV